MCQVCNFKKKSVKKIKTQINAKRVPNEKCVKRQKSHKCVKNVVYRKNMPKVCLFLHKCVKKQVSCHNMQHNMPKHRFIHKIYVKNILRHILTHKIYFLTNSCQKIVSFDTRFE
jgi:hypothetical protein